MIWKLRAFNLAEVLGIWMWSMKLETFAFLRFDSLIQIWFPAKLYWIDCITWSDVDRFWIRKKVYTVQVDNSALYHQNSEPFIIRWLTGFLLDFAVVIDFTFLQTDIYNRWQGAPSPKSEVRPRFFFSQYRHSVSKWQNIVEFQTKNWNSYWKKKTFKIFFH